MAKQPDEYVKLKRISETGGGNVFLNADVVNKALKFAGFPINGNFKVQAYPVKDCKNRAKIILKIIRND